MVAAGWQKLYKRVSSARRKVRTSLKGGSPNILYFVMNLSFVAIYAFLEGVQKVINERHHALEQ